MSGDAPTLVPGAASSGPLQEPRDSKKEGSVVSSLFCSPPLAGMAASHQETSPSLGTTLQPAC